MSVHIDEEVVISIMTSYKIIDRNEEAKMLI